MTTISDNFDRPDDATSLGTASDGGTWTVVDGTHGIASDQAYIPILGGTTLLSVRNALGSNSDCSAAARDTGLSLCDATYDAERSSASNSNVSAIFANYDFGGTGDFYWFSYTGDGWGSTGYTVSGTPHGWDGGGGVMPSIIGSAATLRLVVNGPGDVSVYCNTSLIIHSTGMPTVTGSYVGHGGSAANVDRWDNFSAAAVAPPPPFQQSPMRLVGSAANVLRSGIW